MLLLSLFTTLISLAIPIIIIWAIIKVIQNRESQKRGQPVKPLSDHDFVLAFLTVAAGLAGALAILVLPDVFISDAGSASKAAIRIVASTLFIIGGLLIRGYTGKFLMTLGVVMTALSVPFIFEDLGSGGAFIAVLLAFGTLIALAVHHNKKEASNL